MSLFCKMDGGGVLLTKELETTGTSNRDLLDDSSSEGIGWGVGGRD